MQTTISGARGILGTDWTFDFIDALMAHFHAHVPAGKIAIARDSRPSGVAIMRACEAILALCGRDVIELGICPTPTAMIFAKTTACAGAVIVTASHNPLEYNGIKLVDEHGLFLPKSFWTSFDEYKKCTCYTPHAQVGQIDTDETAIALHIEKILASQFVNIGAVRSANFKIAYDATNGAGALLLPTLCAKMGCEVMSINGEPNGNFAHNPEPVAQNLVQLSNFVRETGAHIGFATDPDADRLAIVDERGEIIGEEFTFALCAEHVLSKISAPIAINLSSSTFAEFLAQKYGTQVFRTPVGEFWVSRMAIDKNCVFAGEGNGGAILPSLHAVRDSGVGAALVLSLMAERGQTVSQLVQEFPRKVMDKRKFELPHNFDKFLQDVIAAFAPSSFRADDGFWFAHENGFVHIRRSNTEPIMRIIVEGSSVEEVKDFFDKITTFL